uniref:Uncharacterized protein n=1 Tax=viral metagenome TaxID=1070528 RepID=A0A6C0DQT1_9ZZZZ
MNSYTVTSLTATGEPSFYMLIILFIVAPLLIGSVIDITFTQLVGSQHCSYKDGETRCTILKSNVPALVRESGRFVVQLSAVICLVLGFASTTYANQLRTPIGSLGLILFIATQSDLIEDFRRFMNGLLFIIKNS